MISVRGGGVSKPNLIVHLSLCILIVEPFCVAGDSAASIVGNTSKRVERCHIETLGPLDALHQIAQNEGVPSVSRRFCLKSRRRPYSISPVGQSQTC
jgi:hypothetical protein